MRIGLVPDIPDQAVVRRVEDVMQPDGQLDDAETGAEMAAGDRNGVDQFRAQFVRDLLQVGLGNRRKSAGTLIWSRSGVRFDIWSGFSSKAGLLTSGGSRQIARFVEKVPLSVQTNQGAQ